MVPEEYRPADDEYWEPPWSPILYQGDLFEAIPFQVPPIDVYQSDYEPGKHFIGELGFAYGLLVTPTCDMLDQRPGARAHPFRVLVPILPLDWVIQGTGTLAESRGLVTKRDRVLPYMYLPPLPGVFDEESVACLYRPSVVSDQFLADPPRRIAQLKPRARQHLKFKLAFYWGRVEILDKDVFGLEEAGEVERRAEGRSYPPSPYDSPERVVPLSAFQDARAAGH
jgi:hypothetical protein